MEYICLIFLKKDFLIQVCGSIILRLTVSMNKMFPVTLTELLHVATLLRFMIIHIHSFEVFIHFHNYEKKILLVYSSHSMSVFPSPLRVPCNALFKTHLVFQISWSA